jgi:hypothetical protein
MGKDTKYCRSGLHEDSWAFQSNGTRYCSTCYKYYDAVRDYKRYGYLGSKRLSDIESYLDSRIEFIAKQIQSLKNEMDSLRLEKAEYTIIAKTKK